MQLSMAISHLIERIGRFNPHPARRPDATPPQPVSILTGGDLQLERPAVSILIQPEGRMQPPNRRSGMTLFHWVFQSSSSQKAGCNWIKLDVSTTVLGIEVSILIQPEGRMQRGCGAVSTPVSSCRCFNPHPARRPDATMAGQGDQFRCTP